MKVLKISVVALTVFFGNLFVPSVFADAQRGVRPCLTSDLIGTWEMRSINSKIKINPTDPFGWPHQRFKFDIRGDVKEMTSTTPIEGNEAVIQKFDSAASTSRFSLNEQGVLSISKLESPETENCMCTYAMRDVPPEALLKLPESKRAQVPHKGDLVLTYMSRNGQPVVIKSLRKI